MARSNQVQNTTLNNVMSEYNVLWYKCEPHNYCRVIALIFIQVGLFFHSKVNNEWDSYTWLLSLVLLPLAAGVLEGQGKGGTTSQLRMASLSLEQSLEEEQEIFSWNRSIMSSICFKLHCEILTCERGCRAPRVVSRSGGRMNTCMDAGHISLNPLALFVRIYCTW